MGLAEAGTPLSHEDTMKWAAHVRKHGIIQFINLFNKQKNRNGDEFKWGDEIEYTLVKFDDNKKEVKLNLKSEEILEEINKDRVNHRAGFWAPEYGAFMIEGTPAKPFEGLNFNSVEENMKKRRNEVKKFLMSDEDLMCITSFPRMGCENFTFPLTKPTPEDGLTKSMFFPDECIFPKHPRYKNTTTNIMRRRGEKPFCNIQVYRDKHTIIPIDDCYKFEKNALPDHVYLDTMGFGCGYSCLQVTFQAYNLNEARILYDQLTPFCPLMMALTAAAPFHRGFITDLDSRWNILCNTQDCRTREEKGLQPLKNNKFVIKKSRHDSTNCYISPEGEKFNDLQILYHKEDYQKLTDNGIDHCLAQHIAHLFIRDTISLFEEKIHQNDEEEIDHFENIQSTVWQSMRLKPPPPNTSIGWRVEFRPCDVQISDFENAAVATFLVLLTRIILTYKLDFLVPISQVDENIKRAQKRNAALEQKFWFRKDIFQKNSSVKKDYKKLQNETKKISFTNRIIENWNLERTLLDNGSSDYKIKTELMQKRRSSLQLKNEYVSNEINKNGLIKKGKSQGEKVNYLGLKNGEDIFKNEIISNQYLRYRLINDGLMEEEDTENECSKNRINTWKEQCKNNITDSCIEMTIGEIINGKKDDFPGIIPLMKKYLATLDLDVSTHCQVQRYIRLIQDRASGKVLTPASWMRKFVMEHPNYKCDSKITENINYDLLKQMQAIQNGDIICSELLGENK